MTDDAITLSLTKDEALVFFEWLNVVDVGAQAPADQSAEQIVLFKMEGQLEKCLVEPLAPNYRAILEGARRKILAGISSR
jgi:hypothetical protein